MAPAIHHRAVHSMNNLDGAFGLNLAQTRMNEHLQEAERVAAVSAILRERSGPAVADRKRFAGARPWRDAIRSVGVASAGLRQSGRGGDRRTLPEL